MYKRGTPEYDLWRASPEYNLYCKRISVAMTGKYPSAETRAKLSMARRGKRLSAETRAKIGAAQMGKRNHRYGKRPHNYGKHHSVEARAKNSAAHKGRMYLIGPNNPNWHGGGSFLPYPRGWNNCLREAIRRRDNQTCILCGKIQIMPRHDVHHINYEKEDLRPENLVTLCADCHRKTNGDREYWENLFVMVYIPDFPKERMMKDESCC